MNRYYSLLSAAGLLMMGTAVAFAGSLSMTTYYPSPTGSYDTLWAQSVGIGTTATPLGRLDVRGGDIVWGGSMTMPSNNLGTSGGGNMELGALSGFVNPVNGGRPYIDLHYGNGLAQDYNVRLINDADNVLSIQTASGGRLDFRDRSLSLNTADPTLGGRVASAFTVQLAGGRATALAIAETTGVPAFALNPSGSGTWTMYDYANNTWNAGLLQRAGNVGIAAATPEGKLSVDTRTFGLNLYGGWPDVGFNSKFTGTWRYQNNGYAGLIESNQTAGTGGLAFYTAVSGTAANPIAWNLPLYLKPNGFVGVRDANPNHELKVAGAIQSTGRIGAHSCPSGPCDPDSGYPGGWGGGVHTWDVYAEGSVGVGQNGALKAYMNNGGEIFSSSHLRINDGTAPARELIINNEQIYRPNNGAYGAGENFLYLNTWNTNGGLVMVGNWWAYPGQQNDLYVGGAARAYGFFYSSDARMKENVRPVTDALHTVMQLQGVQFTWKGTKRKDVGLIAQDVEKVLPELVHEDKRGMKAVEYGNVVAVLIEAVKEQQQQIDTLKNDVRQLKGRI